MNILFICTKIPFPPNKGEKIRTYNQIKYFAENGNQLTVAFPLESNSETIHVEKLKKKLKINIISSKLPCKPLRYSSGFLRHKPLSVSYFYSAKLKSLISATNNWDIIICNSSSVYGYLTKTNKNNTNILVDFMDLDSDKWLQYTNFSKGLKRWVYEREYKLLKVHESKIQKEVDCCIFTSEQEVKLFKKNVGDKDNIKAIGNGLDTDFFSPINKEFNEEAPSFIFAGVMDYKPNEDAVIWFCKHVWPTIINKFPKASFFIAGMNPSRQVKSLANLKNIIVTGFIDDIRDYYQKADIFIAPLRIARGVQNKVLEALACGIPVVCTPNAIQGIECQAGEHVLEAKTADEFIEQILKLIVGEELRERLRFKGLTLINGTYKWDMQLIKLEKIINDSLT